jgi:cellulose synthase/poly-beta-1,6-N-acetylglucosamine synthase-like glycosyltransferase
VIEEKIKNLLALDYANDRIEYVIASDGSTDKTVSIIEKHPGIKLIEFKTRVGKAEAINRSIKYLSGDVVVFSDADVMYEPDAVKKLARNFYASSVGAVCGELITIPPHGGANEESLYWIYDSWIKKQEGEIGCCIGGNGGLYAVRKEFIQSVPTCIRVADDLIIPMQAALQGHEVLYEPQALAYDILPADLSVEFERKIRISFGAWNSIGYMKKFLNPLKNRISYCFFCHKILRWIVPHLLLILFFTNIALLFRYEDMVFRVLFYFQVVCYFLSVSAHFLAKMRLNCRWLNVPYYFSTMQLAYLMGFYRFLIGKERIYWEKSPR